MPKILLCAIMGFCKSGHNCETLLTGIENHCLKPVSWGGHELQKLFKVCQLLVGQMLKEQCALLATLNKRQL